MQWADYLTCATFYPLNSSHIFLLFWLKLRYISLQARSSCTDFSSCDYHIVWMSTEERFHSCCQREAQHSFLSQTSVCNLLCWLGSPIEGWGGEISLSWRGNGYRGITLSMFECLENIHLLVLWINCWVMLWRLSNCCVKPHHSQPVSFSIRLCSGGGEEEFHC